MRSIKAVKQMPKKAHKTSRQVALKAAGLAIDKKAFNLILWDVRPWHLLMDYILILSGHSTKHTQTIAQHIRETFKEENIYSLGVEGLSEGKWILMDYNDVIIHVFFEYVRDFYNLEGLRQDAPKVSIPKSYYKRHA